jgi:acyl-CoA synthetase (AMP-forming)/AMP-acid ligase II
MTPSLADLLDGDDDDVVVHCDDGETTRRELRDQAAALATVLREHDLAGRAIGVLMPNVAGAIAAWFGVWQAGATFVPLNPRVPAAELARMIDVTGVAAVVTDATGNAFGDRQRWDAGALAVVALDPASPRATAPGEAIVQFTSGTTGRPKAVVLRHDTVRELLDNVIGSLRGDTRRRERAPMPNLVPVSLSLWAGIYQVLFAFRLGAAVVLMERFEPREFARLVARYGIRSSVLPPAAMVMLVRDENVTSLEPLRYVRSVSAPLSPVHARAFHERFGTAILNGYGQTELGGEVVGWTAADWKRFGPGKLGAVGRPHAGIDVRVATEGEVGELEIRSPSPLDAADPALAGRVTDDGWLRTGDLGRIDDDGFVWIEGRVSSMINRGGLKVFPDEVEEALRTFDGVADVAVAGVPDARLGEVPWAFVVVAPGARVEGDALRAWAHERMAPYKVPAGVTIVDALPRNEIGKLLRQDLVPLAIPTAEM